MQAYKRTDLYNKYVQEQAAEAFDNNCISNEVHKNIVEAHPSKLYTPNYFIRIALGLLTLVAIICSGLLSWLIVASVSSGGLTALFIFLAICSYIALEFFTKGKNFYNAGVDNILMIQVIVFIVSASFSADYRTSYLVVSGILVLSCLWMCLRFTDAFMAVISYSALFVSLLLQYVRFGHLAKATAPFFMMAVSAVIYFVLIKLIKKGSFLYQSSFKAVMVLALLTFYVSGNYFIVKQLGNDMFHLSPNEPLPFGWIFWIFTILIPPGYILYGIAKKNILFIRTGLFLIAATIFTIRYYHAILPGEVAMLIGGVILFAVSYGLIKYLVTPKYGFSFVKTKSQRDLLNVEALVIAQTFGQKHPAAESGSIYGGGSGGGGGATGDF